MKKSIGAQSLIQPNPVLIVGSYNEDGSPNIMNAAWGGICCSKPPCAAISLREATLTYHNILREKCFTINIPSEKFVKESDYVGIVSGRDTNKFRDTGLTAVKSKIINAPMVAQFPLVLECKLVKTVNLGLHTQFIGEILDITADEEVLNEAGAPDIEKVKPMAFGSMGSRAYYAIGKKLGNAFEIGNDIKKGE